MKELKLSNGQKSFDEINKYLLNNFKESYSLSLYDILSESTAEIECTKDNMLSAIMLASNTEHDFPEWIGINELTDSIVVGMNFTKGNLRTNCSYKYIDKKFIYSSNILFI